MTTPLAPAVRFDRKYVVDSASGCWLWQASRNAKGYGQFAPTTDTKVLAHRWSYERAAGPIPEGLQLDHRCRNRACVNPDHLEPVTALENIRRGETAQWQRDKTHCPRNHEYTPENTYMQPGKGRAPSRVCRTCQRERRRVNQ